MTPRALNLALIVVSFLGAPFCTEALGLRAATPNLAFIAGVPGFLIIGIVLLCFMFHASDGREGDWVEPGLRKSSFVPFSEQPLQIFWMNGHVMAAMALGSFLHEFFLIDGGWAWVFFACVACGCYAGVRLAMLIFKGRMS